MHSNILSFCPLGPGLVQVFWKEFCDLEALAPSAGSLNLLFSPAVSTIPALGLGQLLISHFML